MVDIWRRQRAAIAVIFFVAGALIASWASRIPAVKDHAGLSDGQLGVALLAIGAGTVVSLPLTSLLIARFGSAKVVAASAVAGCAALSVVGRGTSFVALTAMLACFGAAVGALDVAMNAQAVLLERAAARSVMSSLHGQFSLGGLAGAALGVLFAGRAWTPSLHFAAVSTALGLLAIAASRGLIRESGHRQAAPALAWPSRAVLGIGCVAACGAVVEGGITDWSGLYLRDTLGAGPGFAAAGFAAFSLAMMFGRFAGDRLIDRRGGAALARIGASITAAALAAALCVGNRYVAILAFTLSGLGMCTLFPVVFSAAGGVRGARGKHAIAAVATMSYGALLLAPPAIGFAAGATSLPIALGLLVLACALIVALAGLLAVPAEPRPPTAANPSR